MRLRLRYVFVCFFALMEIVLSLPKQAIKYQKTLTFDINQLLPQKNEQSIDLGELLRRVKKNYQLIAKNDGVSRTQAEKMSALLEFGPTIVASYSYQYQTDPKLNSGRNYYGGNQVSVTANWELYSGFSTMNKVRQKDALYQASLADKNFTEQNLYLQVIQQYYAYFTNYSHLVSLKQKKKLLQNNVVRLQKLYASGLTTVDDLESLKAESSLTDYQIAQKELDLEQNRLNLSLLTNSQVHQIVRSELKYPNLKIRRERFDLIALKEQAQSFGFQKKQISYAPRINFYDTFTYGDMFGDSTLPKPKDKIQNTVGISVNVALDSFSLFKQREAIGLQQMQTLKELEYKKQEQNKDISFYKKSLDIAKIKIKSAEAGLKSALITFENVNQRYDAQLANYVDYLNALSQKSIAEATYVESLNYYEMQKANFVFHSGQDLRQFIR